VLGVATDDHCANVRQGHDLEPWIWKALEIHDDFDSNASFREENLMDSAVVM